MEHYVTGQTIRTLREKRGLTQKALAEKLYVSDKAVSKWETGRGLPDGSLLQPLAEALGVSLPELLAGEAVVNRNRAGNLRRLGIYVCPVCGNVITAMGEGVFSCCGIRLPVLEAEEPDEAHPIRVERVEDEYLVTVDHPMDKDHYISFLLYAGTDRMQLVKLYPEGPAQTRFFIRGRGTIYACCNRHGLFAVRI